MIRKVSYESQERREKQVLAALNANGIQSLEEANQICEDAGVDPYQMCEDTQRICFENAKWAYVAGAAIAIKKGAKTAADAAEAIGIGLQAFCIPGSVADDRKVGLGHGNLAARLLREETQCFAFLAGHESFAAAEGAIKIAEMVEQLKKWNAEAGERDETLAEMALAWILQQKGVTSVLVGASSTAQLEKNMKCVHAKTLNS